MIVNDIISDHRIEGTVDAGEIVTVSVDRIYLQDGNSPTLARLFDEYGFDKVADPSKVGVFFDHSTIWPDGKIANRIREAMTFCEKFGFQVFRGGEGISHVVAMEEGWFEPGSIVIGSDSHTCTGGANQSLALGMGASDVAAAMLTGETWLRVPETVSIKVVGTPSRLFQPKDLLIYMISNFGQNPFLYRSLEWNGDWVSALSADQGETIASMAVDMGAKCVFLPPHEGRSDGLKPLQQSENAKHREMVVDISELPPYVAMPNSPGNGLPIDDCAGEPINYVFIGSCTNSRLEDIAEAARVMKGAKVHPKVHCLITPGSKSIYLKALELGYIEDLISAGAIVTPPGCGACLGTQGSIPASGDRVLSTMNRNFLGRMGNAEAEIYLSSTLVAANTAIQGEIPNFDSLS